MLPENINNHEQPKPHQLVYRVLAPEGMTVKYNIIDTGHAVCNEAFAKDTLRFSLAPAAEHPTGTYHANIVVASEEDASLADTLDIIYEVRGKLLRFGSFPQMRNGVSPNIIVTDIDGSFIINMRDYVEDPAGLGMYFEFDETKLIKPNDFYETTAKGRMLDDDRLEITYHLDGEEYFGKDYPMFDFTFTAFNAYNQKNKGTSFLIQVYYDATSSISDKPHSAAVGLYPNPAHDIIHLSSDQPVRAVNIYSVSGTLVGRYIRPADTIRIGHLPSGAYIVQMVTDKETIIRKIIKQ